MGIDSKIEWTEATWNPVRGCTRVSEGCRNCYAEAIAGRFSQPGQAYYRLAKMTSLGARWTNRVDLIGKRLFDPLRWKEPRRIFVNSTSDLYHGKLEEDDILAVYAVMAKANWHTYQILTKRPERMLSLLSDVQVREKLTRKLVSLFRMTLQKAAELVFRNWPLPHLWQGVSIEDQESADKRLLFLQLAPAAIRFVSAEPLLESITLQLRQNFAPIHWLICGGESGPHARPFNLAWAESLREQCKSAGIAFFMKQLGSFPVLDEARWSEELNPITSCNPDALWLSARNDPREDKPSSTVAIALKDRKGGDMEEWPRNLRVREFPDLIFATAA